MDKERCAVPLFLADILDYATKASALVEGMEWEQFEADEKNQLAAVRCLEIIGEAAAKLPREFHDRHPALPWAEMIGMRNRIIHDYFEVDMEFCWRTITRDLPTLIPRLQEMISAI
ncbi:MAG: DUF86 domain-containing protein [Desulfovibrionaceae bacterium]|nr:DUF86 domain-containing protein [Desulfovibrionaceae bacterium]MBF0512993.1 DUF86 domain-containing protein [Desulfovibrionaceae bacterium]